MLTLSNLDRSVFTPPGLPISIPDLGSLVSTSGVSFVLSNFWICFNGFKLSLQLGNDDGEPICWLGCLNCSSLRDFRNWLPWLAGVVGCTLATGLFEVFGEKEWLACSFVWLVGWFVDTGDVGEVDRDFAAINVTQIKNMKCYWYLHISFMRPGPSCSKHR